MSKIIPPIENNTHLTLQLHVFEDISLPCFLFSIEGEIIFANKFAKKLLGAENEDLTGINFSHFISEIDFQNFINYLKNIELNKEKSIFYVQLKNKKQLKIETNFNNSFLNQKLHFFSVITSVSDVSDLGQLNEAHLLTFFEYSNNDVFLLSSNYLILNFKKSFWQNESNFFNKDIVLNDNILDYLPDFFIPEFKTHFEACLRGEKISFEKEFINNSQKSFWFEMMFLPVYNAYNLLLGVSFSFNDISERIKSKNEEAKRDTKLKVLIDSVPQAVCSVDKNLIVEGFNLKYRELFQQLYNTEIKNGKHIQEFVDSESWPLWELRFKRAFENQSFSIESNFVLKNNKIYTLTQFIPIYDNNHQVNSALIITNDITVQKQTEQALIEAKKAAEAANIAKSQFLANMSHEIRTPMNVILGFADILSDRLSKQSEYSEYIKGIQTSGSSLLSVINDILDLSKIEVGKLNIEKEPTDFNTIISEIHQLFSIKIKNKNLQFIIDIQNEPDELLFLDATRIRQILLNLVGNAVKFTPHGFVQLRIKMSNKNLQTNTYDLVIEVIDSGIGIAPNQLEAIFEPFQQHEGQSTRKYGGTGLGLSITKRLVEIMNGKILIESTLSVGSRFSVILPNVDAAGKKIPKTYNFDNQPKEIIFSPATLLVVEDNRMNRFVIRGFLEDQEIRIIEASNGMEALDRLKEIIPDIIVLDIDMPIMDGFEFLDTIRQMSELADIPVISITALMDSEQTGIKMSNFLTNCNDFLRKPVSKSSFIKVLSKYLSYRIKTTEVPLKRENNMKLFDFQNQNREQLMQLINRELLPKYLKVKDVLSIRDVKTFSLEIQSFATLYNFAALLEYGKTLSEFAEQNKIEKMLSHLQLFQEFLFTIKE